MTYTQSLPIALRIEGSWDREWLRIELAALRLLLTERNAGHLPWGEVCLTQTPIGLSNLTKHHITFDSFYLLHVLLLLYLLLIFNNINPSERFHKVFIFHSRKEKLHWKRTGEV